MLILIMGSFVFQPYCTYSMISGTRKILISKALMYERKFTECLDFNVERGRSGDARACKGI